MLHLFEVFLAPGSDAASLLSEETKRETSAQIMTVEEARLVGFAGVEPDGPERRLIAVHARDSRWIQRALEGNNAAASFKVHEVDE